MTLVFLAVSLITLSSVMWWASSNAKVTQQNELFSSSEAAAEAATEMVVGTMERDWKYGQTLQAASIYQAFVPTQTGWPMQFTFSDGAGNSNKTGVTISLTNFYAPVGSVFQNLSGYQYPCTITSVATANSQLYSVSATVQQTVNAVVIPLFQFAIFYNMNLEMDPSAAMPVNGAVFCNAGIWAGTPNLTFNSTVAAAGTVYYAPTGTDPFCTGKVDNAGAGSGTPIGNFSSTPVSQADTLTMPIGTNNSPSAVEAIINLPPTGLGAPNSYAYTTNGQVYMFNAADLIISNSANGFASAMGTNITIWFQDPLTAPTLNQLSNDVYFLKTGGTTNVINQITGLYSHTNVAYASYSFVTNVSYYDYREQDTVQAVQLNITNLNTWLTNTATTGGQQWNKKAFTDKGHGINSTFIYNSVQPASGSPGTLPAVRLVGGTQLPFTTDPNGTGRTTGGLTVVTPQPIYVYGYYNVQTNGGAALASLATTNTGNTYPAALMGDAITVLSPGWKDTYAAGGSITLRIPTATTVNAACLEGIVQSTNSNYSGGVENFLRLEENWNNTIAVTYNGSIVVMFPSIYATNPWPGTGSVYNAPKRNWGFDLNFEIPNLLPPLSPKMFALVRGTWTGY
jgi:hypothetical protein